MLFFQRSTLSSGSLNRGFTLIEMIMVILILGIMAVGLSSLFRDPVVAVQDMGRRMALVDSADTALRQIKREVTAAIPNSVRVYNSSGISVLEFFPIVSGGRYRLGLAADDSALSPGESDDSFDVLNTFGSVPTSARVVINSVSPGSLYTAAENNTGGIISPSTTTVSLSAGRISLSSPYQFDTVGQGSARKRFYITQSPVTIYCDKSASTIKRYANYVVKSAQPTNSAATPLSGASNSDLLVDSVSDCQFSYDPGTTERAGLLTMRLSLDRDGEVVRLLHQVPVRNVP